MLLAGDAWTVLRAEAGPKGSHGPRGDVLEGAGPLVARRLISSPVFMFLQHLRLFGVVVVLCGWPTARPAAQPAADIDELIA
jgi:hypothetical protein